MNHDNGAPESSRRVSQASRLVELCAEASLFHDGTDGYATVIDGGHKHHWSLRSTFFRRWLARRFHEKENKVPSTSAIQAAIEVLQGQAFESEKQKTYVRLARICDVIWLDLADDEYRAVRVTKDGWEVVEDPPVRFRRPKSIHALPVPQHGGSMDELRPFVNTRSEVDFTLVVAWVVGTMQCGRPVPVLIVSGEQGSAKSSLCRLLRRLVDPSAALLRSCPRDERDLMIAANGNWVLAYDNISILPGWSSDAICRLSTGGGFATRKLYENDEEVIFEAIRPVILNGIEDLATRSDLLDRAIQVTLLAIPEDQRRTEAEIESAFTRAHPRILGALLDAVSMALRNFESVSTAGLPRMADFARFVTAAEPALPFAPGAFSKCYMRNRETSHELALEASPIYPALRDFIQVQGNWNGTAAQLLSELNSATASGDPRPHGWPKAANVFAGALRRIAPNLRANGVQVEFVPRTGQGGRQIRITKCPQITDTHRHQRADDTLNQESSVQCVTIADMGTPSGAVPEVDGVSIGDDGDDQLLECSVEEEWTL